MTAMSPEAYFARRAKLSRWQEFWLTFFTGLGFFFHAWVLLMWWRWFALPLGLPEITYWKMVAAASFIPMITKNNKLSHILLDEEKRALGAWAAAIESTGRAWAIPKGALLFGWVLHHIDIGSLDPFFAAFGL